MDDANKSNEEMKTLYDRALTEFCMAGGHAPNIVDGEPLKNLAKRWVPSCREYTPVTRKQVAAMAKEELLPATRETIKRKVDTLDHVAFTCDC